MQVHKPGCPHLGLRNTSPCQCPLRLAYTTVDSYIGKLRSIFNDFGCQGDWNRTVLLGNPATDLKVKQYLKEVTTEQLQARITQSKLHLSSLINFFYFRVTLRSAFSFLHSRRLKFSLLPEIKHSLRLFFSGDRGSDLGHVKTSEIARFPDDNGFLFNHIWRKTLRDGSANIFGMRRHPNPTLCPIRAIETYVAISRELGFTLSDGYLFRATNQQGHVVNKLLLSSTAESRFKKYIRDARTDSGESLHSFRSGCAITLALSGSPLADVMSHVGWTNPKTALYYIKLADVIRAGSPSDLLASNASSHQSQEASRPYAEFNMLKNFLFHYQSLPCLNVNLLPKILFSFPSLPPFYILLKFLVLVLGILFEIGCCRWFGLSCSYLPFWLFSSVWPPYLHTSIGVWVRSV